MPGFAKAGQVISSGSNLAIAGVKPSGVAAQGQVIWSASAEPSPWQFLASATARSTGTGNYVYTTPPIDTTGATLLIVLSAVGSSVITDSQSNNWLQLIVPVPTGTTTHFYCSNPTTSTAHTFTVSNAVYGSMIVLAYKGSSAAFDKFTVGVDTPLAATTAQASPITPSAAPSLLLSIWRGNGSASAVDSNFNPVQNLPYLSGQSVGLAVASQIQSMPTSVAPTWNVSMNYASGEVTMLSFIPAPWQLLANVQFTAPATTSSAIDTRGATLLVVVANYYSVATPGITDSSGNLWIQGSSYANSLLSGTTAIFYCASPITSASHTFTINSVVSAYAFVSIAAFKAPPSIMVDQSVGNSSDLTTSVVLPSMTPSAGNGLVISAVVSVIPIVSVDYGLTIYGQDNYVSGTSFGGAIAYLTQEAAAAIAPTWTSSSAATNRMAATMMNFVPISVPDGLVDYWPMNEGSGTTFNNAVNPSNPMTAQNITWAGQILPEWGYTPYFNGTTAGAVSTQPSTLNGPFSLCIAVVTVVSTTGLSPILFRSLNPITGSSHGFQFTLINNSMIAYILNATSPALQGISRTIPGALISMNNAYYVCMTYDGSGVAAGVNLYINGALQTSVVGYDNLSGPWQSNVPIYIGQDESGGSRLNGTVANARIYNRVLTQAEITALSATMGR